MHKWYVAQVLSAQEKNVKKLIEDGRERAGVADLIEEVLVPTEHVAEVRQGKKRVTEKRVWPGYLLLKMTLTDESWAYVKGVNGVIDFLGGEQPTALSKEEVDQILQDLEAKKETVVEKHKFSPGDRVKITDGVFVNFIGTIIEVNHDKGRLSAMVSIFGRDTRVDDLEFWQVEEVSDEVETAP